VGKAELKVSYYLKNSLSCPVCRGQFKKEEMFSGGGRLIAGDINDELRRSYLPSKKVGEMYPLIYPVTVCPECLYAAYSEDFPLVKEKNKPAALSQKIKRQRDIKLVFPIVDFKKPRNLFTGAASYLLAVSSYSFLGRETAPTFKKGLSCLRAAWLFDDLNKKYPGQNYDRIKLILYKKAMSYYEKTVYIAQTGEERIDSVKIFGPDLDKNYGFQGVLFISTLLMFKYGDEESTEERIAKLEGAKRIISKVFGSGKSSKSKPSFILDTSKDLYEKLNEKIAELGSG